MATLSGLSGSLASLFGGGVNGLQSAAYEQAMQQQAMGALQNLYAYTTTTGTNSTLSVGDFNAPTAKVKPVPHDEIAWLKRRVREIEWRA